MFSKLIPHIQTFYYRIITFINLKRYLLYWIENFIERGHIFSHINERNISTINDKRNMSYKYYINQPKHMAKIELNQLLAKQPHLINK